MLIINWLECQEGVFIKLLTCVYCNNTKKEFDFVKGRSVNSPRCKDCQKEMSRKHYQANKEEYKRRSEINRLETSLFIQDSKKDKVCTMCKQSYSWWCMGYSNRDKDKKGYFSLEIENSNYSKSKAKQLIQESDLFCLNCLRQNIVSETKTYKNNPRFRHVYKLKNKPCVDCGKNYPHNVMEFDHVRGIKKFNINQAVKYKVKIDNTQFLEEIDKCELVCVNCHNTRTYTRRSNNNKQQKDPI